MDRGGDSGAENPPPGPPDPSATGMGPPPQGSQRQWTHPSEVGMQARVSTDRRRSRLLVVGLVAAGVGVMLATAAITKVFAGSDDARAASGPPEVLHDCLAMVEVIDPSGSSHTTGLLVDDGRHVVVSGDGFGDAQRIAVRIGGARTSGSVVAQDPYLDIAVLRLETPSGAQPAMAAPVSPGDTVRLVRFDDTGQRRSSSAQVAATGLIWSRPDHTVAEDVLMLEGNAVESGVLAGHDGRVAGLVIGSQDGHSVAWSAEELAALVEELMGSGQVEHPWIGVRAGDADAEDPDAAPVGQPAVSVPHIGAHVIEVVPGSPAEQAGIRAGDVIRAVDGHRVADLADLVGTIAPLSPGEVVGVEVIRGGEELRVDVEVSAFPG